MESSWVFLTSFEGPKPNLGSFDSKLNEAAVGFGDELTKNHFYPRICIIQKT